MPDNQTPYHHGSHKGLLQPALDTAPGGVGVDAILVPTRRPSIFLTAASRLAQTMSCTLVTLHSGTWTSPELAAEVVAPDVDLLSIEVPQAYRLNLPEWETSKLLSRTIFACTADISPKRNIALMLSHMLGWSRILFLDDDITSLDPRDIHRASNLLSDHCAVGLGLSGFPDNSVVCHAFRMAGGRQQTFIGGGALVIGSGIARTYETFFPNIYNDDWFFLLSGEKAMLPTTVVGEVVQYPYDPFGRPDRAREEELGDVLAEGIFWLLDQGRPVADADEQHWTEFLERRLLFISGVLAMLEDSRLHPYEKERRRTSLKASLEYLAKISPDLCQGYVKAWIADRIRWRHHLDLLPTQVERAQALATLSRRGFPRLRYRSAAPRNTSGPIKTAS